MLTLSITFTALDRSNVVDRCNDLSCMAGFEMIPVSASSYMLAAIEYSRPPVFDLTFDECASFTHKFRIAGFTDAITITATA